MSVPINVFTRNVQSILSALTSSDSPYAVADTPVSIVLITPGPCLPSMFPDPAKKEWCTQDSMRKYRDAVLEVGKEWKSKEAEQATARGWSIETVDAWGSVVGQAGGQAEELRPYFKDGIHLSTKGYATVEERISRVVQTKFAGRGLDWEDEADLPKRAPMSEGVDWTRPESVLEGMKLPKFRLA